MKILVVGAGGQLGGKVSSLAISKGNEVYGGYRSRRPSSDLAGLFELDKTNETQVKKVFETIKPEAVVDTAALHNVDYCESHPGEANSVNVVGTRLLAEASRSFGAHFVYVSTDFVFDGVGAPYDEQHAPNPLSVYAKTKLEGEKAALDSNPGNSSVVRPAVIYSWARAESNPGSSSGKPLNFGAWVVSQLEANKELNIVFDQVTSPTLADDLAGAIGALIVRRVPGLFHAAGKTALSRYDFTVRIAKTLGLDESLIHGIPTSQLRQAAKRPLNSSLISDKITRETGYRMMDIDGALDKFRQQYKAETVKARS
jgi:dTDP-4-dehydrorhamnose reductase